MENQNMNTTGTATETQQEKTFTQEQVNAIVGKRLAEAKASNEAALNKRETELNQREMQIRAKELLSERGLPKDLAKVLRYSDEESLTAAIDIIEKTRGFKQDEKSHRGVFDGFHLLPPDHLYDGDSGDCLIRNAMKLK